VGVGGGVVGTVVGGFAVGVLVGAAVGAAVGVGALVGAPVGDGVVVGVAVGEFVGVAVGEVEGGAVVAAWLGVAFAEAGVVGACVGFEPTKPVVPAPEHAVMSTASEKIPHERTSGRNFDIAVHSSEIERRSRASSHCIKEIVAKEKGNRVIFRRVFEK
jgi:hypothetical protein